MNNCRAGLYSFAPTTTWLHEIGIASPPLLVMLGLTLPDSRILSGIASIGLSLANIAIILPHLRQSIRDSPHATGGAPAREQSTRKQIKSTSNATQPIDLDPESPVLTLASLLEKEHQSPPLICGMAVKSICFTDAKPLERSKVKSEVAPPIIVVSPAEKMRDEGQIPLTLDVASSNRHISLFTRDGRDALYIPLPVPDKAEIAFFDTEDATSSETHLGEQHPAPEERSNGSTAKKDIDPDGRFAITDLSNAQEHGEIYGNLINITMAASDQLVSTDEEFGAASINAAVQDHHNPAVEGSISDFPDSPACGLTAQASYSLTGGKEIRRPESLEFIPQSVIRRYPSAPVVSTGHGSIERRTLDFRHVHQVSSAPLRIFVQNPTILLEGTRPRASYATLEAHRRAPFLTEVHPTRQSAKGQSSVIGMATTPDLETTVHELTPLKKQLSHIRRMSVPAHAAVCDRRSSTRSRRDDGDGGSSDSDSDSDNHSQHSDGSSAYDSIVPHMLGADLIAAIDANSESDLDLARTKWRMHTPLNVYEDGLVSEKSIADVSMIMQVSSHNDASDGEVNDSTTLPSLTYEDIQQWASGVVQKCARQVCRNRAPTEPSSPSQVSDVCAERPSGSGVSQCPLSGLHCKLGAAALTGASAPGTKEPPVSFSLTSIMLNRKPLRVRNLRDVPEFVPRQRHISTITGGVEGPRKPSTRSSIDATHAAATRVIARMETQARFNTRQWLVGMDEKRMVNTAGGRQSTLRCA